MADSIFRKKSLDNIKTPDTLDQYIRVANVSSWLLIFSILFFLVGVIVWGCFGKIETKVSTQAFIENGTAVCSVSDDKLDSIKPGMVFRIDKAEGAVWTVEGKNVIAKINFPDGSYDAAIITEAIQPLSLLFN